MPANLEGRLGDLVSRHRDAQDALKAASEQHARQNIAFQPLMAAHVEYGTGMNLLLGVLESSSEVWSVEGGSMVFSDDDLETQFDSIMSELDAIEQAIGKFQQELYDATFASPGRG